ncbi:LOW QUALITY PROTEIN: (+)-neomenthol dehydrogenase-like [Asparagus officinalis]|nr:LOW QUALITY PROTEIN: (+)-neomenthol dehydrogenase-like [Asparagus officinalis]
MGGEHVDAKWWSASTVVVVTGANKGIGLAFVKRFAELGATAILTARDVSKGLKAGSRLPTQPGFRPIIEFHPLDVTDLGSVSTFASWLRRRHGGLDVLVNNAGVSFNEIGENSVEHAEAVIKTNFYGPKLLIEALMPLFRQSATIARILNVSSRLALQKNVTNPSIKNLLQDEETLSEGKIEHMISQFLDDVYKGTWKDKGWPKVWTDYSISKLALYAHSKLLAKQNKGRNISVNCFCPGFTRTAMTGGRGDRTAEEAAEVGARIALLPPHCLLSGEFFKISTHSLTPKL